MGAFAPVFFACIKSVTRAAHCMNSSIEMPILGGMPIDTAVKTWAEANAHPMSARPLDDPCAGLPGKARKEVDRRTTNLGTKIFHAPLIRFNMVNSLLMLRF